MYSPQIVSIALGTNDVSNGDGKSKRLPFDSTTYVNNYIAFIKTIRSKYPAAKIALLSSPTVQGSTGNYWNDV
jgi:lysophospholipase L1-like esterase